MVTHRPFSCTLQSALTFSGSSNFLGDFLFLLVDLRLLRGFLLEIAVDLGKLDDPMFRGAQFSLQFLDLVVRHIDFADRVLVTGLFASEFLVGLDEFPVSIRCGDKSTQSARSPIRTLTSEPLWLPKLGEKVIVRSDTELDALEAQRSGDGKQVYPICSDDALQGTDREAGH